MTETVAILGARGRFGRHAAAAFGEAGWRVRGVVRRDAAEGADETVLAEGGDAEAVTRACDGAAVIVQALNPPYPDWARELPRFTDACLAAAKATGATVVLPGNVYVYGSAMPEALTEATPRAPDTRKGRLRVELERAYEAAAGEGVRTILLRGGDFLDTRLAGNWFERFISAEVAKGRAIYPGPTDRPHAWAFLPDMARAAAALAAKRAELPAFRAVGFPGLAPTGAELAAAMGRAAGRELEVRPFPWWQLRLISPFSAMIREVLEMRYLWDVPHRIDGADFEALLPDFPATPLDEAVRAALAPRLT